MAASSFQLSLAEGTNADVHCMRLTLDPVQASYRPFAFYAVTHLTVKMVTAITMKLIGDQQWISLACVSTQTL